MKTRSLPFQCSIADKAVGISLRHGGGLQEPDGVYVRCDERDCQYVDLNQAPCPLRVEMFADASDDSVAAHIATHAGKRFCYACLTELLGVTHEQVRRASWRLKEVDGFAIKPARCVECQRRRVTIGVTGEAGSVIRAKVTVDPARSATDLQLRSSSPLAAHLQAQAGFFFCAHCLARVLGSSPASMRDAMWSLEALEPYTVRTAQCVSCLLTKRVIRFDPPSQDVEASRRIVETLINTPGEPICTTCLAFAADMALPDARRLVSYLEGLPDFRVQTAACSVCGRWLPAVMAQPNASEDPDRVTRVGDTVSGTIRYRGFRIDLLSFRMGEGWRPFALVKSAEGARVPSVPALMFAVAPSKATADAMAAEHARDWIDKRIP